MEVIMAGCGMVPLGGVPQIRTPHIRCRTRMDSQMCGFGTGSFSTPGTLY
jgi:hypothetical protein